MDPNVFETANAGFAQAMYEEFLRDPTAVGSRMAAAVRERGGGSERKRGGGEAGKAGSKRGRGEDSR